MLSLGIIRIFGSFTLSVMSLALQSVAILNQINIPLSDSSTKSETIPVKKNVVIAPRITNGELESF
jgi:hypothetical protein